MEYSSHNAAFEVSEYNFSSNQIPLFPLDPWGAEHVFQVFDHPTTGIASAMIGPIPLGAYANGRGIDVRCLAVTDDREYVALLDFISIRSGDSQSMWSELLHQLNSARKQRFESFSELPMNTPDCVKSWLEISSWNRNIGKGNPMDRALRALSKLFERQAMGPDLKVPDESRKFHELRAQATIVQQMSNGVTFVLSALHSELLDITHHRRRLSMSMSCQLLALAKPHGELAVKYALQALRTESFGVIALITTGQPSNESRQVREAIFCGKSLPEAFESLGVPKAAHRQTVCKVLNPYGQQSTTNVALSELAMTGREWLVTMRLSKYHPPHSMAQWHEFGKFVRSLCAFNLQDSTTVPAILQWCAKGQYPSSSGKLLYLIHLAEFLQTATKWLASYDISLESALEYSLGLVHDTDNWLPLSFSPPFQIDINNTCALVTVISEVANKSLDDLMSKLMRFHPGVPDAFTSEHHSVVIALNSLEIAMNHGNEADNCLSSFNILLEYLASGVALYEIRTGSGASATVALKLECSVKVPKVYVHEIEESSGDPARYEVSHIARLLADACSTEEEIESWFIYESQCDSWRHYVGPTC